MIENLKKVFNREDEAFSLTDDQRKEKLGKLWQEIIRLSQIPEHNRGPEWEDEIRLNYTLTVHLRTNKPLGKEIKIIEGLIAIPIIGSPLILPSKSVDNDPADNYERIITALTD